MGAEYLAADTFGGRRNHAISSEAVVPSDRGMAGRAIYARGERGLCGARLCSIGPLAFDPDADCQRCARIVRRAEEAT
jgi:hypothetical protein